MERTLGKFLIKFVHDLKDFQTLESFHSNKTLLVKRLARSISLIVSTICFLVSLIVVSIFSAMENINPWFHSGAEILDVLFVFAISFIFSSGVKSTLQPVIRKTLDGILLRRFKHDA